LIAASPPPRHQFAQRLNDVCCTGRGDAHGCSNDALWV
jgi:hypothetical protein